MGISDRLLNKKNVNGRPHITAVHPAAALPGGEVRTVGNDLRPLDLRRPRVSFGDTEGAVVISSEQVHIARVPPGAASGPVVVSANGHASNPHQMTVAVAIAENLHPVTNPALDAEGNIFVTFSGSRGQKVPVAIYKIDTNYNPKPFVTDLMNPTGLAFDREGLLYVSSRYDGIIYQITPTGNMSVYAEGMGVATGIAFDREENLYVGDRSGTIFKISPERQIFVFATIEPSIAAYHLTFGPDQYLYVTGPTTSSFDSIYRISHTGEVEVFASDAAASGQWGYALSGRLFDTAGFYVLYPRNRGAVAQPGSASAACAAACSACCLLRPCPCPATSSPTSAESSSTCSITSWQ